MSDVTAAPPEGTVDDPAADEHDDRLRLVRFSVAERPYLIAVEAVQEVLVATPPTRLPGSAPAIIGVTSVRGRIIPVVDPRPVLDPTAEAGASERLLVVTSPDGPVALLVDRVDSVIPVAVDDVADAPPPASAAIGHVLLDDTVVPVIDPAIVIALAIGTADLASEPTAGPAPGSDR